MQDWPYEIAHPQYEAYMAPPHDVGGQADAPVRYEEKEEELWELNTYVTCEVLGWRGVWNAEERRRRGNNDLGLSLYYGFPYYGRLDLGRSANARRQKPRLADRVAREDCRGESPQCNSAKTRKPHPPASMQATAFA